MRYYQSRFTITPRYGGYLPKRQKPDETGGLVLIDVEAFQLNLLGDLPIPSLPMIEKLTCLKKQLEKFSIDVQAIKVHFLILLPYSKDRVGSNQILQSLADFLCHYFNPFFYRKDIWYYYGNGNIGQNLTFEAIKERFPGISEENICIIGGDEYFLGALTASCILMCSSRS